ncbi:MAG: hypothetical protein NC218_01715 [Acetobacter sp.]|nr:hypothetical protein [Acetobacter sp.]
MTEKHYVPWKDAEIFIEALVAKLKDDNIQPKGIYGIPRGGLPLATMLSYRLELPLLLAPCDGCIIIDDIADTGNTLMHYTKNDTQFNTYYIATMFYAERSCVKPDFYFFKKEDKWIVFPWENC